ncbi:pyridoxamine 5'-phosphate oxidase [Skeletonema marinoi]|uniref:Pyridoxamine 5'-phosphate oxidase n=1 Tax=Skeletonema marinoi TaxID=267567 RepID=A0AAD8YML3_9STRA|nr:pyridoxamine 5'-phosphate oxidase [Skeletonema marinoi]
MYRIVCSQTGKKRARPSEDENETTSLDASSIFRRGFIFVSEEEGQQQGQEYSLVVPYQLLRIASHAASSGQLVRISRYCLLRYKDDWGEVLFSSGGVKNKKHKVSAMDQRGGKEGSLVIEVFVDGLSLAASSGNDGEDEKEEEMQSPVLTLETLAQNEHQQLTKGKKKKSRDKLPIHVTGVVDSISPILVNDPQQDPFAIMELYQPPSTEEITKTAVVIIRGERALSMHPAIHPGQAITLMGVFHRKWKVPDEFRKRLSEKQSNETSLFERLCYCVPGRVILVTEASTIKWNAGTNLKPDLSLPSTVESLTSIRGIVKSVHYHCEENKNRNGKADRVLHYVTIKPLSVLEEKESESASDELKLARIYLPKYATPPNVCLGLQAESIIRAVNIHFIPPPIGDEKKCPINHQVSNDYLCYVACLRREGDDGIKSTQSNERNFRWVHIDSVHLSCVCLGPCTKKKMTSVHAAYHHVFLPSAFSESVPGHTFLFLIDNLVFIGSVYIVAKSILPTAVNQSWKSELNLGGCDTTGNDPHATDSKLGLAVCLEQTATSHQIGNRSIIIGRLMRNRFKFRKVKSTQKAGQVETQLEKCYEGWSVTLCHIDHSGQSASDSASTLQTIEVTISIPFCNSNVSNSAVSLDALKSGLRELFNSQNASNSVARITSDQETMCLAWWHASGCQTLPILSGGLDLSEDSLPVHVEIPLSARTFAKLGYQRFRCHFSELEAYHVVETHVHSTSLSKGNMHVNTHKILPGMLNRRLRRTTPSVPSPLTYLKPGGGISPVSLAELHWDVCKAIRYEDSAYLKPSLLRRIHDVKILGVSFCRARVECQQCFKTLVEKRGNTELIEGNRAEGSTLLCPSGCSQSQSCVKWECSAIVDDGTGQAKLYAEREAALLLLGTELDIASVESGAWYCEEGVFFQPSLPPSSSLAQSIRAASAKARKHISSSKRKYNLGEELSSTYSLLPDNAKAEYLLQQHCRHWSHQHGQRRLDLFCRCKPLSEDLSLNGTEINVAKAMVAHVGLEFGMTGTATLPPLKLTLEDACVCSEERKEDKLVGWDLEEEEIKARAICSNSFRSATRISSTAVAEAVNGSAEKTIVAPPEIRLNVPEKARTVTAVCTSGTLCTSSHMDGIEGAPFGSFVDYVLDDTGNPVLLMNEMSMHTINIQKSGDGSLVTLFAQLGGPTSASGQVSTGQDVSRCSVTGTIEKIESTAEDWDALRMRYGIAHSYADQVMDSPKFHFYRLIPTKIYFVGGFGVSSEWVPPEEYKEATPDILSKEASKIVERLNHDHAEDLMLTATQILDVEEVDKIRVTGVDRLGMDLRVTRRSSKRRNKLRTDEFRVGFRIPVISVEDAKSEVLKVFQEAWEKSNGVTWGDDEVPGADVPVLKTAEDNLL